MHEKPLHSLKAIGALLMQHSLTFIIFRTTCTYDNIVIVIVTRTVLYHVQHE